MLESYNSIKTQIGFSLIELIVALTVLAIGAFAFTISINQSTLTSIDPVLRVQANAIARAYIEEIGLKSFCDPNWDNDADPLTPLNCPADCSGAGASVCDVAVCRVAAQGSTQEGTRDLFDDICDYDGLADVGALDQLGNPIANLGDYNVDVAIVDIGIMLNGLNADIGQVARIDVTVTHAINADVNITLTDYRTNF